MTKVFLPGNQPVTAFNQSSRTNKKSNMNKEAFAMADTVQGLSQKNARMWQIMALVLLSSVFIALFICFYAVTLPRTVPVIVTVDSEGAATYIGKVDKSYYGKDNVPEIAKIRPIKRLLISMYTRYTDMDAQRGIVAESRSLVQDGASSILNHFYANNNPYDDFGYRTASVDVEEPLKQSEHVYIVNFTVTEKSTYGTVTDVQKLVALVTIGYFAATEQNPLGIYITNFDIKPRK